MILRVKESKLDFLIVSALTQEIQPPIPHIFSKLKRLSVFFALSGFLIPNTPTGIPHLWRGYTYQARLLFEKPAKQA